MSVYRSPKTGNAVTRAGYAYASLWTGVIGARAAFSYGSIHWFGPQLGRWMANQSVTSSAITDGLIFMAVGMLLTSVIAMGVRARNLPADAVSTTRYAPRDDSRRPEDPPASGHADSQWLRPPPTPSSATQRK
jgi:hypothetical protein